VVVEESFGVIPFSQQDGRWSVFLIQHKKGRYWGFPKGHAESGELPQQSAFRELKEETNLDCVRLLQAEPLVEEYSFLMKGKRVSKRVLYYIAEVGGQVALQTEEIQQGMWIPFPQAFDQVTHPEGREILTKAYQLLHVV